MITTILLIIAFVLFAGLSLQNLKTGVLLLLVVLPSYLIRFSVGRFPTTFLEILIAVLLLVWLVKGPKPDRKALQKLPIFAPLVLLLLAATIGIFIAPDHLAALGIWKAYFIEPAILFVMIFTLFKNKKEMYQILTALGAGGLIISILGVVQKITEIGIPFPWNLEGRITSIFDFPNALGLYLAPLVTIAIVFLLQQIGGVPAPRLKRKELVFWIMVKIINCQFLTVK